MTETQRFLTGDPFFPPAERDLEVEFGDLMIRSEFGTHLDPTPKKIQMDCSSPLGAAPTFDDDDFNKFKQRGTLVLKDHLVEQSPEEATDQFGFMFGRKAMETGGLPTHNRQTHLKKQTPPSINGFAYQEAPTAGQDGDLVEQGLPEQDTDQFGFMFGRKAMETGGLPTHNRQTHLNKQTPPSINGFAYQEAPTAGQDGDLVEQGLPEQDTDQFGFMFGRKAMTSSGLPTHIDQTGMAQPSVDNVGSHAIQAVGGDGDTDGDPNERHPHAKEGQAVPETEHDVTELWLSVVLLLTALIIKCFGAYFVKVIKSKLKDQEFNYSNYTNYTNYTSHIEYTYNANYTNYTSSFDETNSTNDDKLSSCTLICTDPIEKNVFNDFMINTLSTLVITNGKLYTSISDILAHPSEEEKKAHDYNLKGLSVAVGLATLLITTFVNDPSEDFIISMIVLIFQHTLTYCRIVAVLEMIRCFLEQLWHYSVKGFRWLCLFF